MGLRTTLDTGDTKMRESRANLESRVKTWACELSHEDLVGAVSELVMVAIDAETVRFWDDCLAPYWESTGEPVVEGQAVFYHEEQL